MEITGETGQEELKALVDRLSPAFDILPDALRIVDLKGHTLYVNRPFLQLTGFSPTELMNQPLMQIYVEEDRPNAQTAFESFKKSGQWSGTFEARIRRKGGGESAVSLNCALLKNARQEIIGAFAIFRDVSRLERIMEEPMELLKLTGSPVEVLRQLPARVASYFPGRPWVMINLVEGAYLRFAHAVNVPAELMAQGGEPIAESICGMVIAGGKALAIGDMTADDRTRQDPLVGQYGCRGYMGSPIVHSSGRVLGTICILRSNRGGFGEYDHRILGMFAKRVMMEIERMELETKIEESEKDVRDLIEQSPVMIWRISPDGQFTAISNKGKKDLGYKETESIRDTWFDLVHPDDLPQIKSQIAALSARKKTSSNGLLTARLRIRKRDGEYGTFFTTIRPVYDLSDRLKILEGVTFEIPAAEFTPA